METLYEIASRVVLSGWVALVVAIVAKQTRKPMFLYAGLILPGAIATVYVATLVMFIANPLAHIGDLSTLPGYKAILTHDAAATATWLHLLAFDLFVGTWVVRDGIERGIARIWLIPVLLIVLVVGPAGLLVYLLIRTGHAILSRPHASIQQKTS